MQKELNAIKRKYGEEMMHFCRSYFSTILESPGILLKILESRFNPSRRLFSDLKSADLLENFKSYIYKQYEDMFVEQEEIPPVQTPEELLSLAGYDLYECHTEEEIQSFKKYYASGEEICTFNGGRLSTDYVYFAVKKDVDKIRREDFLKPERQDLYGTSVISIQFSKDGSHTLSIKNRYNHMVSNCDATFSNNLDNIIPGLTASFSYYHGMNQTHKTELEIKSYVRANDGRSYKYNYEIDNVHYCSNNIIIDSHNAKKYPSEEFIIMDYFILDRKNKNISLYKKDNQSNQNEQQVEVLKDSFVACIGEIGKIEVTNDKTNKIKTVTIINKKGETSIIELDAENKIIGFKNDSIEEIPNDFLVHNRTLRKLELPKVKKIGNNFLKSNQALEQLSLESVESIGDDFLSQNTTLCHLSVPNLVNAGDNFLKTNMELLSIDIPKLQKVGYDFLPQNMFLSSINAPELMEVGNNFLSNAFILDELFVPKLTRVGDGFLKGNKSLKKLSAASLTQVGNYFLMENEDLNYIYVPSLVSVGDFFLNLNRELKEFNGPSLEVIGNCFLHRNRILEAFNAPKVRFIGDSFLYANVKLESLFLPMIEFIKDSFLYTNTKLKFFFAPLLKSAGMCFLSNNMDMEELELNSLEEMGNNTLCVNKVMRTLILDNIKTIGDNSFSSNTDMTEFWAPKIENIGFSFLQNNPNIEKFWENPEFILRRTKS